MFGPGLIAVFWKEDSSALAAAPAVFFPALMLAGALNTYSDVPQSAFALVGLVPCFLWFLLLPSVQRSSVRRLAIVTVAAMLIPCAAGAIMAARAESLSFDE